MKAPFRRATLAIDVSEDDIIEALREDLIKLRQRAGAQLSRVGDCAAILSLQTVSSVPSAKRPIVALGLIEGAIKELSAASDKLLACVMLAIDPMKVLDEADREDPLVAPALRVNAHKLSGYEDRLRRLPGASFEGNRDRSDRVAKELAHQLYKLGSGELSSWTAEGSHGAVTEVPAAPSGVGIPPFPTPSAALPCVFISYSRRDDNHIRVLMEHLRKARIETLCFAIELDTQGLLIENIREHAVADKRLLIALTPQLAETGWLDSRLPEQVLPAVQPLLREIVVLELGDGFHKALPVSLRRSRAISFKEYPEGLARLLQSLGSEELGMHSGSLEGADSDEYYTVSGAFEIERSQSEMFAELQTQITSKPYEVDMKYLYWDVRAADRWRKIADSSNYLTAQTSQNLIVRHGDAIVQRILDDSEGSGFSFINFGVGTGVKDFLLLDSLLRQTEDTPRDGMVAYFPVDESLSMIQITIQSLQELLARHRKRLKLHFVLDDFDFADRFQRYIYDSESQIFGEQPRPVRILGFLAGSIGNFEEAYILSILRRMMTDSDYLILGVEYVAGRREAALTENYSDEVMADFLSGPIMDAEGVKPDFEKFRCRIEVGNKKYSSVKKSQTVVGTFNHRGQDVQSFFATKYEREELEEFLSRSGFAIVDTFFSEHNPPRYGKYILKTAPIDERGPFARIASRVRV